MSDDTNDTDKTRIDDTTEPELPEPELPEPRRFRLLDPATSRLREDFADKGKVPTILAGLPRSWLMFEAGRALLEVATSAPMLFYPNEVKERIANLSLSFLSLAGVCNIPAEQAIMQIDAQIRQALPVLYFLEVDEGSNNDKAYLVAVNRAVDMLQRAFLDVWGEPFGKRLETESNDRPKLRSGGNRIMPAGVLVDPSKLKH